MYKQSLIESILPVSGGAVGGVFGAVGPVFANITWMSAGELCIQAAIFAIVGGLIGLIIKRASDRIFSKKNLKTQKIIKTDGRK